MNRRPGFVAWIAILSSAAAVAQDYVDADALSAAGMSKYWQVQLPLAPNQSLTNAYLVDDQIYACTDDGYVYAVHAYTGAIRWLKRVTDGGYRLWRPAHAGDRTIFVTPAEMRQYDRHYGDSIRSLKFRFAAGAPAVSDGRYYFVGGIDQRIYAFRVAWDDSRDDLYGDYEIWKVGTHGQLLSRPVLFGPYVAAASDDGRVYACRARDKRGLWITGLGASITADLAADEKGVYAACRDQSLYLLEATLGKEVWRARLKSPLSEPPVLSADRAYQFSEDDGVVAIVSTAQFAEERVKWNVINGRSMLTFAGAHGFMLGRDEQVLRVRLDSGEIVNWASAPGMTLFMPQPAEPVIYLGSPDGRLYCARPAGTPSLTAEQVREALRVTKREETAVATSQPAGGDEVTGDRRSEGPILGGKSKVSREFKGGQP